jgi:hypothetical protein
MSNGIRNGFSLEIQQHARMRGSKACFSWQATRDQLHVPFSSLYMAFIRRLFRTDSRRARA